MHRDRVETAFQRPHKGLNQGGGIIRSIIQSPGLSHHKSIYRVFLNIIFQEFEQLVAGYRLQSKCKLLAFIRYSYSGTLASIVDGDDPAHSPKVPNKHRAGHLRRACGINITFAAENEIKMSLQVHIESAWNDRSLLEKNEYREAVREVIAALNEGKLRVADPGQDGSWKVHEWVKKAVILYFPICEMKTMNAGPMEFYDKIPLKSGFEKLGIRVVPHAIARYGSYVAPGAILMPSYVNIGAYVDSGTMVDTWATVGSCAQIGKNVHLSGGVGIGGVLEPVQASPVIIGDNCFIGSRCIVVEGVHVEPEAVLGANVVLTMSTKIIDVTGSSPVEYKGRVPARSVVIPGSYTKKFPAGEYQVPCALIIGQRKESTDKKTSLNDALRDHSVAV